MQCDLKLEDTEVRVHSRVPVFGLNETQFMSAHMQHPGSQTDASVMKFATEAVASNFRGCGAHRRSKKL